jgi:hypothetical protein
MAMSKGKGALVQHNKCEIKMNKHEVIKNKCEIAQNTRALQEILWMGEYIKIKHK